MLNITRIADHLAEELEALGFKILSQRNGNGLPVVAFRLGDQSRPADSSYDEFALAHQLRERGWIVPAYTMAPHSSKLKLMRVVVREDFTLTRCKSLLNDIKLGMKTLEDMDAKMLDKYTTYVPCPWSTV